MKLYRNLLVISTAVLPVLFSQPRCRVHHIGDENLTTYIKNRDGWISSGTLKDKGIRQTKEHLEKRSRARDEGSRRHMGSLESAAQDRVKWKQFISGLCSTSGVIKA